jgi:hypothetical protein
MKVWADRKARHALGALVDFLAVNIRQAERGRRTVPARGWQVDPPQRLPLSTRR